MNTDLVIHTDLEVLDMVTLVQETPTDPEAQAEPAMENPAMTPTAQAAVLVGTVLEIRIAILATAQAIRTVIPAMGPAIRTLMDPAIRTLMDQVIRTLMDPAIKTLMDPAIRTPTVLEVATPMAPEVELDMVRVTRTVGPAMGLGIRTVIPAMGLGVATERRMMTQVGGTEAEIPVAEIPEADMEVEKEREEVMDLQITIEKNPQLRISA